jgi:MoxR-like ATPase
MVIDSNQRRKLINSILDEVSRFIIGKKKIKEAILIALLSEGHILLEGSPGVGKTLIAKSFASTIGGTFRRIQMTPDLLPSDIVGSTFFDVSISKWTVRKGAVFTNVLLADELNRATPKAQSALLEVMQERQVTIEGQTYPLIQPFMVIATQVPYGSVGTYPLTEVQIDRFAYGIVVDYPDMNEEMKILSKIDEIEDFRIENTISLQNVNTLIKETKEIFVSNSAKEYLIALINRIRKQEELLVLPSPRASIWLLKGSRARAYLDSRSYVIPDDIKEIAISVIPHRIRIKHEYSVEEITPEQILTRVFKEVEVPKAGADV